ncbi:hypothetical protein ACLBOM_37250 [Escherichia coli]
MVSPTAKAVDGLEADLISTGMVVEMHRANAENLKSPDAGERDDLFFFAPNEALQQEEPVRHRPSTGAGQTGRQRHF